MRLKFFLTKIVVFCFVFGTLAFEPNSLNAQNQEVVIVGELGVFTAPDNDAEVFIDGIHVGHTPFLKKVEVGKHQLTVKKEMYYDYQEEIVVGDARLDVKIKLEPKYGMLRINTKPFGAMVYFNGIKYPTRTPCISGKIMAGSVAVKIELEDYHTVDTVVIVDEGKVTNLYVQLEKQPVFESMAREDYDYQLSRVYITNDDNNFVELDTTGFRKVSDVTSSIHHDGNTLKNKSKIKHGFWLKGGLGISNVYGKDAYGETINWSTGDYYSVYPTFYIGGQYTLRFNRYVGLAVDLNYSRTGYQYSHNDEVLDYGVINKFTFDGIELPFAFRTYFLKNGYGPMIELGGILNYRKYCKVDYSVSTGEKDYLKEKYGSLNWGLVAGLGCDFKIVDVACSINARVVLEMSKVFDDVDYKLIYFQFGIGVKIF
ncbi:MAG: PEGA domain-containing protein [Bacteroidales bacterium]|nr:PEGA domain-containing protein [Bacteroidales bacterium]